MKKQFFGILILVLGSIVCFTSCDDDSNLNSSSGISTTSGTDINTASGNYSDDLSELSVVFVSAIDITEGVSNPSETSSDTVFIVYNGDEVTITNAVSGVVVENTTSAVNVTSTTTSVVVYSLSGSTTSGSFTIASSAAASVLELNGISMENAAGSAINNQSAKALYVHLAPSTVNAVSDGSASSVKGAIFSKGNIEFSGNGTLNITGNYKNAVNSSKGTVTFEKGNLFNIVANANHGIKAASGVTINGSIINITATGAAGKGISSDYDVDINGGRVAIQTLGDAYYDETDMDVTSASGVKADRLFTMTGGELYVQSSGAGGKGISCDSIFTVSDGKIGIITTGSKYVYDESLDLDASPKGIKADSGVYINGGQIAIRCNGATEGPEGLESKRELVINGGTLEICTTDDAINASSFITINGGMVYARATNNDAIDSNGTLCINGGVVVAVGSSAPEGGFDCDENDFQITGGVLVGFGGSSSSPSTTNTQPSIVYGGTSNTVYALANSSGDCMLTYDTPDDYTSSYVMLLSTPNLTKGSSYNLCSGVTASGGTSFHGLCTNGTYSNVSSSTTITVSSAVTTSGNTQAGGLDNGPGGFSGGMGGLPGGGPGH